MKNIWLLIIVLSGASVQASCPYYEAAFFKEYPSKRDAEIKSILAEKGYVEEISPASFNGWIGENDPIMRVFLSTNQVVNRQQTHYVPQVEANVSYEDGKGFTFWTSAKSPRGKNFMKSMYDEDSLYSWKFLKRALSQVPQCPK